MKLEKAIEILTDRSRPKHQHYDQTELPTIRLGIEAMKLIKLNRELWGPTEAFELPGETKED